jgi:hypothetical protein
MKLLTTSRGKDYRACPRLHHIQYDLGFRPIVEAEVLRFGTLMHRGLEAWWKAKQLGSDALAAALEAIRKDAADPYELVRAEVMMIAYDARWGAEELDVLAVEVQFETALINPATGAASRNWRLAGKIDVVVRDRRTGQVLIVEHKTSAEDISPGSDYTKRLRLDGQISVYYAGARSLGHDVAGCIYDILGKPSQKPLKATPVESRKYTKDGRLYANQRDQDETPEEFRARLVEVISASPDEYFQRAEVVRLEAELEESGFELWQLAQQIREAELAQRFPRNPDSCVRYGRTCPYFDVCTGAASLEDGTRFKRREIHPELTQEGSAA